jgi:hypothetical protein
MVNLRRDVDGNAPSNGGKSGIELLNEELSSAMGIQLDEARLHR